MRTSLSHLPERKQADIARIVELIHSVVAEACEKEPHRSGAIPSAPATPADPLAPSHPRGQLEKIILFGSHARGDWVFDHYVEDGITYEYVSDYDILVVTGDQESGDRSPGGQGSGSASGGGLANAHAIWDEVRDRFYRGRPREGPDSAGVSLIVHTIKEVNRALEEGRYFFADIQREGVLLYDAQRTPLANRRETTPEERLAKAKEEFENWFGSANEFYRAYEHAMDDGHLKKAAFFLHRAWRGWRDGRPRLFQPNRLRVAAADRCWKRRAWRRSTSSYFRRAS